MSVWTFWSRILRFRRWRRVLKYSYNLSRLSSDAKLRGREGLGILSLLCLCKDILVFIDSGKILINISIPNLMVTLWIANKFSSIYIC